MPGTVCSELGSCTCLEHATEDLDWNQTPNHFIHAQHIIKSNREKKKEEYMRTSQEQETAC